MSESANQTVLTGPEQGVISDGFGTAWTINESGSVVAGGSVDTDPTPVVQIAFVNNLIWRQHATDLRWSCKKRPADPWGPPTHVSPLPGAPATDSEIVDNFNSGNNAVLAAIAGLRADFDAWKATQPPSPTPTQIMQALTAFRSDLDGRENSISGQISSLSTMVTGLTTGQTVMSDAAATDQTTLVALLDQVIGAQVSAANAAVAAAASSMSDQNVLVVQLNAIQAALTSNQSILLAALNQLVDAATGPTGLATIQTAIATLQTDFGNLTTTLNDIAVGISAKLQQILLLDDPTANAALTTAINTTEADVIEILTDVRQILSIVQSEEPAPPVQLTVDLADSTHTQQAIPPKG